jgi:hypothetical protein
MKELISKFKTTQLLLEEINTNICEKLGIDNFEWIVEGKNNTYSVQKEIIMDGYKYSLVMVDDVDHEYHNALYVEGIK